MAGHEAVTTGDEFKALQETIESGLDYARPAAFALGLATVEGEGSDRRIVDVRYTRRNYEDNFGTAAVLASVIGQEETGLRTGGYLLAEEHFVAARALLGHCYESNGEPKSGHGNVSTMSFMEASLPLGVFQERDRGAISNRQVPILGVVQNWEDQPESIADLYVRLYGLSDRARLPNTANISPNRDFGILPNVVFTPDIGTFSVERLSKDNIVERLAFRGISIAVEKQDKIPNMLGRVNPEGVRIVDAMRVRLGAYLSPGTVVMPSGFVNFNAGTLGESMVEGRISQGVIVGNGSDIGGGASLMGTMSGGGTHRVSVGERCLVGANAGIGISLGDDSVVEAGLYVTGGTIVNFEGREYKARDLSGSTGLQFWRNSRNGAVEAHRREGKRVELNPALHKN